MADKDAEMKDKEATAAEAKPAEGSLYSAKKKVRVVGCFVFGDCFLFGFVGCLESGSSISSVFFAASSRKGPVFKRRTKKKDTADGAESGSGKGMTAAQIRIERDLADLVGSSPPKTKRTRLNLSLCCSVLCDRN